MWPFKTVKSIKESGMFDGFIDSHSHILPGVDDGIKRMSDSLEVLRFYEDLGIRHVWLTPHIMEDYPNTTAELRARFEELKKEWNGKVELHLAAENMLDTLFEERLEAGDFLPIGEDGRHLLVETSYYTPPIGMDELLDKVKSAGYFPVLAHPERYRYMDEGDYIRLKELGVLFQINFASLVGGYGDTARKKCEWLLSKGMADLTGSDLHRLDATQRMIALKPTKNSVLDNLREVVSNGGKFH